MLQDVGAGQTQGGLRGAGAQTPQPCLVRMLQARRSRSVLFLLLQHSRVNTLIETHVGTPGHEAKASMRITARQHDALRSRLSHHILSYCIVMCIL